MKRIFVDMDGCVAAWQSWATMKDLTKRGYFQNLAPVVWMIELSLKLFLRNDCEVFILTKFLKDAPDAREEKDVWLNEYMPFINDGHRIYVPYDTSKEDFVKSKFDIVSLTPDMILLDDYSENLHSWITCGGTSVKVMNGNNGRHGTFKGKRISEDDIGALLQILY